MSQQTPDTCAHDCASCGVDCPSRERPDFSVPLNAMSHVGRVIAVASGKGGVGKSLVTAMLAVMMARKGYKCAILDADITGPSIPAMFGIEGAAQANELGILPRTSAGDISIMSINLLLEDPSQPVIWRGPVVGSVVKQFWSDVFWADVDFMFVDMPPGTGDVPLTVFQSLPIDGVITVTSPQDLVNMVVTKAVHMAQEMDIPLLGVVENMSYITCPDCGKRITLFPGKAADEIAAAHGVPVLGRIPLDAATAALADAGRADELDTSALEDAGRVLEGMREG